MILLKNYVPSQTCSTTSSVFFLVTSFCLPDSQAPPTYTGSGYTRPHGTRKSSALSLFFFFAATVSPIAFFLICNPPPPPVICQGSCLRSMPLGRLLPAGLLSCISRTKCLLRVLAEGLDVRVRVAGLIPRYSQVLNCWQPELLLLSLLTHSRC